MKKICFIIMPFSGTTKEHNKHYWTNHFENFLKPIIEENPLIEAKRSEPLRGDIIQEIINNLYRVPIVVAELTDHNSNVYWELGVRQSLKFGTITIAEEGTKIPFNISTKGTLFYRKDKILDNNFKKDLIKALDDCMKNPNKTDSIVLDTIGGRGTVFQTFLRGETIRRLDGLINDCLWNERILDLSLQDALKFKLKKLKLIKETTSPIIRLSGIELLLSNRYINADKKFYKKAENYWMIISGLKIKLSHWADGISNEAKDLIRLIPDSKKICEDFKKQVEKIRNDLTN